MHLHVCLCQLLCISTVYACLCLRMCMFMYIVFLYVYLCIYVCISVYVCICFVYVCVCACMCVCQICETESLPGYVCACACARVVRQPFRTSHFLLCVLCACANLCTNSCAWMRLRVCMCLCTYALYMYIHICNHFWNISKRVEYVYHRLGEAELKQSPPNHLNGRSRLHQYLARTHAPKHTHNLLRWGRRRSFRCHHLRDTLVTSILVLNCLLFVL